MPGNSLGITLPTVGTTVGPTYATQINAAIQALIDDVEANIVTGEITINADLSFASAGTSYGATDLDRAVFTEQGSALASGNTLSVYAYADELYFQDGAGNNVALTSGGSVAAAAGNITTSGSPAYGASDVELAWVGGDLEFQFKAGASAYADLVFHDADFRNGANTMTMDSLVTSDYAIHWPAAGPSAAGSVLQSDASGNISFDDSPTFTGLVTASAGVTAAANQDFTVSGTGAYNHGDFSEWISGAEGQGYVVSTSAYVAPQSSNIGTWTATGASCIWVCPLRLKAGKTVQSIDLIWNPHGAAGTKFTRVYEQDVGTLSPTDIADTSSSTSTASTVNTLSVVSATPFLVDTNKTYVFHFTGSGGGEEIVALKIVYKE